MAKKIPQAYKGTCVDWHGFDGKHYTAHVDTIRNGYATITYMAQSLGERIPVKAYVSAETWAERVNRPQA